MTRRWMFVRAAVVLIAGSGGLLCLRSFGPLQWPTVLVYTGLVIVLAGLASVIRPPRWFGIATRSDAGVVAASGALLLGAGLFWPVATQTSRGDERLDAYLPVYDFDEFHELTVHAAPERVMEAMRQVSFADIGVMRTLGRIRNIALLRWTAPDAPVSEQPILTLISRSSKTGFFPLEETDREFLFGMAGQPWNQTGRPVRLTPETFTAWMPPGQVKIATSLRVQDMGTGRTRLSTETRVQATDAAARRTMARYWRFIYPGSGIIRQSLLQAIRVRAERMGKAAQAQRAPASFLPDADAAKHLRDLEAAAAADPNHSPALRPLAHLYAEAIFSAGPLMQHAVAALEHSKNVWILGNAAHALQSFYNGSLQAGRPNSRAAELAERYFLRAKRLDPNLSRAAILPQIDMQSIRRTWENQEQSRREWAARYQAAVPKIRRLPVDAFPMLPATIATILRERKCTVPQPSMDGQARNVIRGEFITKGQTGWAVLCSVNHSTSLLVFRDASDTSPQILDTAEDLVYLQGVGGDEIGYSRQITPVGREFIVGHYRAYGGPEPPPIDHHGIDDAFLDKASVTLYFHGGKWLRLQGAD